MAKISKKAKSEAPEAPESNVIIDSNQSVLSESPNQESNQEIESVQPAELSELDKLIQRRTGYFGIKLDLNDLKWIKNACNGKFAFEGPNEAFMLMNCYLGFSSALARYENEANSQNESNGMVSIQAAAIEAAAILLNKYKGNTLEAAERVFRIAVALNQTVMSFREMDTAIEGLRKLEAQSQNTETAN